MGGVDLLQKIDRGFKDLCEENRMKKIKKLLVVVNEGSDLDSISIYQYLKNKNPKALGNDVEIEVRREDLGIDSAIINCIEAEKDEKDEE